MVKKLIDLFTSFDECKIHENLQELYVENNCISLSLPNTLDFENALKFVNNRDRAIISIILDEGESIDFLSGNSIDDFFNEVETALEIKNANAKIFFTFKIVKINFESVISSYLNEVMIRDLLSLELKGVLYTLNNALRSKCKLLIESQIEEIFLETNKICILNKEEKILEHNCEFKIDEISKLKSVANFSIINDYEYVPEDFFVVKSSNVNATKLFNKISFIFSIGYLFDITTLENNSISYSLNGYKSIIGKVSYDKLLPECLETYYKIYRWCYSEGNFIDKIGLARNIISLHLEHENSLQLKGDAFQSLLSNYKIYQKQNIKQYIEIRNKISEQLLNFNERADKIVETFASGFQKSALALISFYISAIAIKLLDKGEFVNLFTLDATVLAVGFILCSFIYFIFSSWEVKVQRQRFIDSYLNLKNRYLDLLDDGDINRILNNDKEYNADLQFITAKKRNYTIMWLLFLGILLGITLFLFFTYNLSQILNTRFWHFIFGKNQCWH